MNISKMKNTVVLKNLPSNIIDEAIVFLKNNTKVKQLENIDEIKKIKVQACNEQSKDYIIKEAECVITNYLSDIEQDKKIKDKNIKILEQRYNKLKKISSLMFGIMLIYTAVLIAVTI